jgi:hypothetical protein
MKPVVRVMGLNIVKCVFGGVGVDERDRRVARPLLSRRIHFTHWRRCAADRRPACQPAGGGQNENDFRDAKALGKLQGQARLYVPSLPRSGRMCKRWKQAGAMGCYHLLLSEFALRNG